MRVFFTLPEGRGSGSRVLSTQFGGKGEVSSRGSEYYISSGAPRGGPWMQSPTPPGPMNLASISPSVQEGDRPQLRCQHRSPCRHGSGHL